MAEFTYWVKMGRGWQERSAHLNWRPWILFHNQTAFRNQSILLQLIHDFFTQQIWLFDSMNFVSQQNCLSESINFVTVNPWIFLHNKAGFLNPWKKLPFWIHQFCYNKPWHFLHNQTCFFKSIKGGIKKRPFFVVFDYEGVRTPPLRSHVGKWNLLVKIFVVVDVIGLEMDFTLETNRKRVKEKLLKRT